MYRKILYRGKVPFNGTIGSEKWVEGDLIKRSNRYFINGSRVYNDSVSQFIATVGDTPIFEGDIGRRWNHYYKSYDIYVAEWIEDQAMYYWVIRNKRLGTTTFKIHHQFTVCDMDKQYHGDNPFMEKIGNLFDNSDLIKTKDENIT